ncbi:MULTISPECIES: hypothetical protein [Flavobacterium]|uniref:hypothetical protein n=1 Tax=Flavobacterium TaxID=237 RepID=UPI0011844630|nr:MULTISPECIES: hypothetical protein [Flavobacterium]MCR4030389.1 hypothetical protein [Flavobacterium panacis]
MKKILTLFAVVGMMAFSSCSNDDDVDNDTIPQAFEVRNQNFTVKPQSPLEGLTIYGTFYDYVGGDLFNDETVLIYRLKGTIDSQTPIWQLIPTTLFFDNGDEITYDYDFSKEDFKIYVGANFNLSASSTFATNQTFRIVIIPSVLASSVNKANYLEVMKAAKLSESQIKNIKL